MKIKNFTYTKDSGEVSERTVLVIAEPKTNYLMYDVSKLEPEDIEALRDIFDNVEEIRDELLRDFEDNTGIKLNSLWRSFKPEGIAWNHE